MSMTSPSGGSSARAMAEAASPTATTSKPSSPSPRDSTKRSSGSSSTTSSRKTVTCTGEWLRQPDSHLNAHRSGAVQDGHGSLAPMTTTARPRETATLGRKMLNKVPEVTIFFWVIKIMCTTVGETAADYLNDNLGFGLTKTTYVTGALLIVLLAVQFRLRRYVPGVYWSVVVVISVFGTLITDNMTDGYNVPLTTSTIVFSIVLAAVFASWYAVERTLSIHTIFTTRREAFYWLAILFTFALGTAAGDLSAEKLDLGYAVSILIFGGLIAAVTIGHYAFGLNAVLSFWLAYILTRPLGASIGDEMSQNSHKYGGLGLGTTGTSYIFLGCILALVAYLSITRKDATEARRGEPLPESA